MAETPLPVTALFGGILTLVWILLSLRVGLTRVETKKYYGAEQNTVLFYRSRGAGTIGEYGVGGILLLALLEYHALLSPTKLWWWAAVFTASRFVHGLQLSAPKSVPMFLRPASFLTTVFSVAFASVVLIQYGLSGPSK